MGILNPKRHATGGGPMLFGKIAGVTTRLIIDNKVDVVLTIQLYLLGTVPSHPRKTQ